MSECISVNHTAQLFLEQVVIAHAQSSPHKPAIVYRDNSLTYLELAMRIDAIAASLLARGVVPGDFVAILLEPGLDITAALLGTIKVGAIYAPMDPEHPDSQLEERFDEIKPRVLLTQEVLNERAQTFGLEVLTTEASMTERMMSGMPPVPSVERSLSDPACIFFTSGTTGKAKGVLGSQFALREAILSPARFLSFDNTDTLNSIARYAWSISMMEMLVPLVVGGTSIILDRAQALDLDGLALNAGHCTAFHCPPALLKSVSEQVLTSAQKPDLSGVRLVWYGGDRLSTASIRRIHEAFPNAQVGTAYGCTEIFGLSHCHLYRREDDFSKVLIGQPVDSIVQRIIDADGRTPVDGAEGEIFLGGGRVALEYWQQAALSEEKFIVIDNERFYGTGDFARIEPSGDLEFVQRKDSQVKIRGIRIELGEVEHHFSAHGAVRDVAVIAKDLDGEHKELVAFIVPEAGITLTAKEVRQSLDGVMPDYMMPAGLHIIDKLPVTENFKIDRKALLAIESTANSVDLDDPMAAQIAQIWQQAASLNVGDIGDNFFEIGGNSLTAALLAALLTRELGRTVEVADVYACPTLESQVALLRASDVDDEVEIDDTAPTLAVQGQKGLVFRELFEKGDSSITCTRYISRASGFDDALVREALGRLVERYPTLRTHMRFVKRTIELSTTPEFKREDLLVERHSGLWSIDGEGAPALMKRPCVFDLKKDTLIMASVSALAAGGELLQLTAHHVAADDNSMGRLAEDFVAIYEALRLGEPLAREKINTSFFDFARDQHRRVHNNGFAEAAQHVGKALREHYLKYHDCVLLENIGVAECDPADQVLQQALPQKTVKFADAVAALSWGLYTTFGRTEFVFCAHVALQRDSAETPRVGMFVNLMPVFTGVDPQHSPEQHARRTQLDFDEAMSRSNIPYELVLAEVEEVRRLGRYPFDAFVNELHFDNAYCDGYTDVVVPRSFTTDGHELSMSLIRTPSKQSLKYESPRATGIKAIHNDVSRAMMRFLDEL